MHSEQVYYSVYEIFPSNLPVLELMQVYVHYNLIKHAGNEGHVYYGSLMNLSWSLIHNYQ